MPLAKLMGGKRSDGRQESRMQIVERKERSPAEKKQGILLAAAVAAVGGAAGWGLSRLVAFSVLILIGSMAACAAVNIKTGRLYMPKAVRRATQILSGALIGISVTAESLSRLRSVLLPALFVCCGFVLINLALALVLHRVCGLDMATAVLSSAAGGATEAALTAPDLDADPSVVSVLQISRLVCTTSFYPLLVQLVYQLL